MEDLKQIISSYLKIDAKKIKSTTFIDKTTIPGSIMIHRMYSELKQNGYEVMHPSNIRTFGDLEKTLSGESNQSVIDSSEKNIAPLQIEIENGSIGIDIESPNNLPDTNDFLSHQFYIDNFSKDEISYCSLKANPKESFCGLFAAKEAIVKADSRYKDIPFVDIEIILTPSGKPRFNGFDISISHVEFSKNNLSVAIVQKTPKSSSNYLHTSKSNDLLHKWSAPILFLVLIIIIVLK